MGMTQLTHYLGVDTGGTFTDLYLWGPEGARIHKVLSTPESPERAIVQGIEDLELNEAVQKGAVAIVHGTTVATNAALEGKGVRTVFITNVGFGDMLTLGRQNREDIYALQPSDPIAPVPASLCVEVDCRRGADGSVVEALTDAEITRVIAAVKALAPEAIAINLLFAYQNPEEEQRLAAALADMAFVSCSHEVLAEYKEYERGMATWLNAWLGPKVADYLTRLHQAVTPSPLGVMQSSGGTMSAAVASRRAVNMLLSGPAGGLAGALFIGKQVKSERLLTFDMGGTSTDVALLDGAIALSSEARLGPYPVAVPMVDMHTIGAGGGSLAFLDKGGLLHVGPASAGAHPGPACYGLGGQQATVTDANVVLGRLRPEFFLGGRMPLALAEAESAVGTLAKTLGVSTIEAAQGIVTLANEHMVAALRVISVHKGHNPADFDLCCFGGAGGLHMCALAEALNVKRILVPANGGVLSAFGMLVAPKTRQLSKSILQPLRAVSDQAVDEEMTSLAVEGKQALAAEGAVKNLSETFSVDCRYLGQSFYINLPWSGDVASVTRQFHQAHKSQLGHALDLDVELVNIRVQISVPAEVSPEQTLVARLPGSARYEERLPGLGTTEVWWRSDLAPGQSILGPAIICEEVATTLVGEGWRAELDVYGHLRLMRV